MFRKALMAGACALALLSGSPVQAAETSLYNQIGDWQIKVDQTLGNGCFAYAPYKRGSVIRIGFDNNNKRIYFLFGNSHWEAMDEGKSYAMRFQFDDGTYFDGESTVVKFGEYTYLNIKSNPEFMSAFAKRNTLEITMKSNGKQLMYVNLTGTYAAMIEVLRCQGAQDGRDYLSN